LAITNVDCVETTARRRIEIDLSGLDKHSRIASDLRLLMDVSCAVGAVFTVIVSTLLGGNEIDLDSDSVQRSKSQLR
jgi:hypothetical protein